MVAAALDCILIKRPQNASDLYSLVSFLSVSFFCFCFINETDEGFYSVGMNVKMPIRKRYTSESQNKEVCCLLIR